MGRGLSEEVIGDFLRQNPHRFSIATKGGIVPEPKRPFRQLTRSPSHLLGGFPQTAWVSITSISTTCIGANRNVRSKRVARNAGRVCTRRKNRRFSGFSEIAPFTLRRAAAVHPVRAVQNEYSLWTRMPELGLIDACRELGTAFVAFFAAGSWHVLPIGFRIRHVSGSIDFRGNNPRFQEPNFSVNCDYVRRFNEYAESQGTRPATMALAWVLHQGPHVIAIPGTRTADHLEQDAGRRLVEAERRTADRD